MTESDIVFRSGSKINPLSCSAGYAPAGKAEICRFESGVSLIVLLQHDIYTAKGAIMENQTNSTYVGVWQPVKAEVKLFKGLNVSFENAPYTLDLKADGSATVTKEKAVDGTWTANSDGTIHVIAGETDDVFKVKDDHLELGGIGVTLVFEKKQSL